jgi:hypothetical protein
VDGGERKEGGEKIIHLLPNNEDVDNTCQSERSVALRRFAWDDNWVFSETGGGVTRRQNSTNILNASTLDQYVTVAFNFFTFLINTKTPLTPHEIYKKKIVQETQYPKDKSFYFKIQGYLGNLIVLNKR